MKPRLAGLAAIATVACAAALATSVRADEARCSERAVPSISVEGDASRDAAPDMAVISIGVSATRATAQDATDQTSRSAKALIETAKSSGVADLDIATTETTLSPVYDAPKDGSAPRVRAFQSTNVIAIKVRKLDDAGALAGRLVDQGANELRGIDFVIADPEPMLDVLRAEAARNARHRAEIYAQAIGSRLGQVILVTPDAVAAPEFQLMKAAPRRLAAPAAVPLAPGTQKLEARVTITWALDQAQP